jgi:hypothetical protein
MDKDSRARKRQFPPSLSAAKSDLPDIGVPVDEQYVKVSCQDYPIGQVLPILLEFQKDELAARRHWPWVAVAIRQYAFERSERRKYAEEKYAEELSPTEIIDLLRQIKKAARDLGSAMEQLEALSSRLNDPGAPLRRPHLAWLNALVTQAVSGLVSTDVNEDDFRIFVDDFKKNEFLKQLDDVKVATTNAIKQLDKSLLKRKRSQSDPALPSVISICGGVWKSLTGRTPTAEWVERGPRRDGDPDFVVFVQNLVKCAGFDPPSRKQVATSLQRFRPPN